jgi:hypothetical protein
LRAARSLDVLRSAATQRPGRNLCAKKIGGAGLFNQPHADAPKNLL